MNVRVQQDSSMRQTGWWDWSVWLTGAKADLDQIEFVEYVLHPTFRKPVQRRTDRSSGFRLNASGWGEFLIHINLHTRDKKVVKLEHWLRLSEPAPAKGLELVAEGKSRIEVRQDIETVAESATLINLNRPRLYLSYAVADASVGEDLRDALSGQRFDVIQVDSLVDSESSESLRADPDRRIRAVVFLISEVRNPRLSREVEAARAAGLWMLAVTVGERARVPSELASAPQVHMKDGSDVEQAAAAIAGRLRKGGLQR